MSLPIYYIDNSQYVAYYLIGKYLSKEIKLTLSISPIGSVLAEITALKILQFNFTIFYVNTILNI